MKKYLPIALMICLVSCKNKDKPVVVVNNNAPAVMGHSIVNTYKHDTSSYTQGLVIYNGAMYEGTGNYGFTKLRKVDMTTGKMEREISLDKKYFGEGITILRDTVYQLTWKEKKVFVYRLNDFSKIKEYDIATDGWGLTNDGTNLIVSTGGSDLYFYDPSTFKLLKTQTVTESGSPVNNINELEYINGYVYANQYLAAYILKIDTATGIVVAKADVSSMWQRIKAIDPNADVPNGIAYDAATKKIYITGKLWPELYEVQFSQ
ncbi:MAG: glutaminyl-peptide cyclotransferase [Chitinophagaceae bacterium]|nr:glutaminyl-peptide cyclotransferase [Chitinophagaceae bacterium]